MFNLKLFFFSPYIFLTFIIIKSEPQIANDSDKSIVLMVGGKRVVLPVICLQEYPSDPNLHKRCNKVIDETEVGNLVHSPLTKPISGSSSKTSSLSFLDRNGYSDTEEIESSLEKVPFKERYQEDNYNNHRSSMKMSLQYKKKRNPTSKLESFMFLPLSNLANYDPTDVLLMLSKNIPKNNKIKYHSQLRGKKVENLKNNFNKDPKLNEKKKARSKMESTEIMEEEEALAGWPSQKVRDDVFLMTSGILMNRTNSNTSEFIEELINRMSTEPVIWKKIEEEIDDTIKRNVEKQNAEEGLTYNIEKKMISLHPMIETENIEPGHIEGITQTRIENISYEKMYKPSSSCTSTSTTLCPANTFKTTNCTTPFTFSMKYIVPTLNFMFNVYLNLSLNNPETKVSTPTSFLYNNVFHPLKISETTQSLKRAHTTSFSKVKKPVATEQYSPLIWLKIVLDNDNASKHH